ncbi:hypothetical protein [Granulicella tundricola]|uniref:hypothetical protein n=1 Tax=Granulicella tundricola TaxID=940615 RepID=UPI0012FC6457|nr:hypothetical protein [Granulicella tundricola]
MSHKTPLSPYGSNSRRPIRPDPSFSTWVHNVTRWQLTEHRRRGSKQERNVEGQALDHSETSKVDPVMMNEVS